MSVEHDGTSYGLVPEGVRTSLSDGPAMLWGFQVKVMDGERVVCVKTCFVGRVSVQARNRGGARCARRDPHPRSCTSLPREGGRGRARGRPRGRAGLCLARQRAQASSPSGPAPARSDGPSSSMTTGPPACGRWITRRPGGACRAKVKFHSRPSSSTRSARAHRPPGRSRRRYGPRRQARRPPPVRACRACAGGSSQGEGSHVRRRAARPHVTIAPSGTSRRRMPSAMTPSSGSAATDSPRQPCARRSGPRRPVRAGPGRPGRGSTMTWPRCCARATVSWPR